MADHFLTKSQIDFADCLEIGGAPALDRHAALHQILLTQVGPAAAGLFAEPLVSRGNDRAAPTVAWYTDLEGEGVPATRLDETAQAALAAVLSRELRSLKGLLSDPDDGPLVAAALHVRGPGDILSVGGRPVIINWGMLPADVGRDMKARTSHYDRTLGRYLPLESAPPLTAAERQTLEARRTPAGTPGAAAGAMMGAGAGAAASAAEPPPPPIEAEPEPAAASAPPPPPPPMPPAAAEPAPRRLPVIAWLPLLILLLLAGGALAWLLIPGNRIFPPAPVQVAVTDERAEALARDVNQALEQRITTLRAALDGAQCKPDGTLLMPGGLTIEGLLPPDPNNPADAPGRVTRANPTPILPPDPARTVLPGQEGAALGGEASLLGLLEARTAMIIALGDTDSSTGSGFFVGPDLVVTNHHVIRDAAPDGIFVTNHDLGKVLPAQLVKSLGPFENEGADFALLRVPGARQAAYSIFTGSDSLKLQSVIAAGYPGDLLETDPNYQALRSGDMTAVPELTVTDGIVNTEQQISPRTHLVVHSAPISTGNSGGPLVDMCGRVVGVNTFVRQGPLRNLNVALSADNLLQFLQGTGAESMAVSQPCQPQVRRPEAPPAAADAGAAAPTPAPAPAQ